MCIGGGVGTRSKDTKVTQLAVSQMLLDGLESRLQGIVYFWF